MRRAVRQVTMPLAIASMLTGCNAPGTSPAVFDSTAAVTSLRMADSALSAAIEARDAARTASFYALDATLLPVAEPIVTGSTAIEEEWAKVFGIPGFRNTARLTHLEVAHGGSLAYTQGTYETELMGTDGNATVEIGKWVTVWRHDPAAGWRVAVDIFNTDEPPPLHEESTHTATP